jgi:hypothetical protein
MGWLSRVKKKTCSEEAELSWLAAKDTVIDRSRRR